MSNEMIIAKIVKKYPLFKRFEKSFIKALEEAIEEKEKEIKQEGEKKE